MIGMPRVLLAIPVFNEAKSIDRVLSAVKPYVQDILMVAIATRQHCIR